MKRERERERERQREREGEGEREERVSLLLENSVYSPSRVSEANFF